jgi:hypothetical protein
MPRNTNEKEYITVAIRKDSNLMRQLEIDAREKSQPKSHLLVSYAADYVRLCLKGDETSPVPVSVPTLQSEASPVKDVATEKNESSPFITSDLTDDDLSIYGD